ncbi:hypothetical protein I317_03628 [Kwoniella heveanensis CBS 569]|nr:hypothetical protein I317_03628 [Kwoniella heveanensis CBS 569]
MSLTRLTRASSSISRPSRRSVHRIAVSQLSGTSITTTTTTTTTTSRNITSSYIPPLSQNKRNRFPTVSQVPPRRHGSSAAATAAVTPQEVVEEVLVAPVQPVEGAQEVVPFLMDIKAVLENEIGGDDVWSRRVDAAITDLQAQRNGRLAVIGDSLAAPRDVVSALLEDPLADSEIGRRALLSRHEDANIDIFQISQGIVPRRDAESLVISSSWLLNTGYDVIEINTKETDQIISTLLRTDSLLVVIDPIRLTNTPQMSSILPSILSRVNVHFAINGHLPPNTTPAAVEATLREQLAKVQQSHPNSNFPSPSVSFVDAQSALEALDALAAGLQDHGPASSSAKTRAFEVFQNQFLASRIGPLQSTLTSSLKADSHPQLSTARQVASLAVAHIEDIIASDRDIVREASHTVTELRRSAQHGATKARHLSVASRGIEGGLVEGGVAHEMAKVKAGLEERFAGRLTWLSLVGRARVDDVASELGTYLGTRFGVDLERQIIFETGQLSQLQSSLDMTSDQTIRKLSHPSHTPSSTHPFTSPLLLNHLSTLSLSIPPLTPTTLLTPILTRREQLLAQSVPRLQASAQRALLTTYSTALLSMSLSWMSYVPPLTLTSAPTAVGLGLLGVVASLAWGQRMWGKAQKKFWKDWTRITGMMKGDLETRFNTALQTQVLTKPLSAAEGLEKLIEKRNTRLDQLQDKVDQLSRRL